MFKFPRREFLRQLTAAFGSIVVVGSGAGADASTAGDKISGTDAPPMPTMPPTPIGPIQFTLSSPASSTFAPFCLGYPFRKGDVPASLALVSDIASLQVTPKNRWPDGSLKFAVIAGTVALTADTPLTVSLSTDTAATTTPVLTTSHLRATGITASVSCGAFGTAAWAATDWDAPFHAWISGPQMSSWIYRKTVGTDAHMVAWLEVRLFAGGAVEVLPWLENGFLRVPGPTSKAATFGFTLGNTQRFSAAINLPNHCRIPLVAGATLSHWLGADPQVTIKHDTAYLQATALVPAYRATVSADSKAIKALVTTYTPLQVGNHSPAMGSGGYHGSIGLLPVWDVLYLTSASQKTYASMIVNAYGAGRYGIHFRDETTQRPMRFSSYPDLVVGGGSAISSSGASSANSYTPAATGTLPATWASSHHPSLGFMAYLATARWYFMEEVQFVATLNYLKNADTARLKAQGIFQSAVGANTTRGAAWAIRSLAQAACVTPDNDTALRNEFLASLKANVDWNYARYVAQPNNPFGWVAPYSDYTGVGDGVYFEATWMQDFYTAAFGYVKAMELDISAGSSQRLTKFFAWKAQSIVGRLGGAKPADYLYADAAPYTIAVAPTDTPNFVTGVGPWHASWGAIYEDTMKAPNPGVAPGLRGGHFPDATSYWGNLQPAIAYAVQHQIPGAAEAYQRMTSAANWHRLTSAFNANPAWSVRPLLEL